MDFKHILICKRCGYNERCEILYSPGFEPKYLNRRDMMMDALFGPDRCRQKTVWKLEDERRAEESLNELKNYSNPLDDPVLTMI